MNLSFLAQSRPGACCSDYADNDYRTDMSQAGVCFTNFCYRLQVSCKVGEASLTASETRAAWKETSAMCPMTGVAARLRRLSYKGFGTCYCPVSVLNSCWSAGLAGGLCLL